ncbi:hypothetical protein EMIT0P171_40161 [Pseudomonas sp. IT-P171]
MGEVLEFRVLFFLQLGNHRLQGHAALRTDAGAHLANLRMHGAGVFSVNGQRFCWCLMDVFNFSRRYSVALGLCTEGRLAFLAAEPVGLPLILRTELAFVTDGHATYRVMGVGGLRCRLVHWVVLTKLRSVHGLTPVRILG